MSNFWGPSPTLKTSGSSHKKCVTVGMPGDSTSVIGTTIPAMLQWVLMTAVGGSMQQTTIRKRHSGRRSKRRPYDNCAIDACMSKEDALQLWDELHYWPGYLKRREHCDAHLLYMRFEREILNLHTTMTMRTPDGYVRRMYPKRTKNLKTTLV